MSRQVIDLNAVGLDGIASWRYGSEERAPQVIVVVGGVRIVSKPLPGDFTCIDLAAVRDDRLRLDASGFDVVADARWDALMSRLRVADQRYRELPRLRADEGFECESMRYDPTDEQPPAPRPYPTDWPENVAGIAAVFLLGLVVMDLGPWVTGLGLVGFALLLAKILQRLDFLRNCNRGSFAAWLPASRTLAAGLVYGLGVVGCLIRLLLGFAR